MRFTAVEVVLVLSSAPAQSRSCHWQDLKLRFSYADTERDSAVRTRRGCPLSHRAHLSNRVAKAARCHPRHVINLKNVPNNR